MNRKTFIGACIAGIAGFFIPKAKIQGQPIKMESAREPEHMVQFQAKYLQGKRWDIFLRACEVLVGRAGLSDDDKIVVISGKDYDRLIGK